jgi:UDP-GlcNAc3NAcA epimerase
MKKILTIIGARPQFIKCAPVSKVLRTEFREVLIHTGQHYDTNMSDVFFKQLQIPEPDYNLGIGSSSHAVQTGNMMIGLEEVALKEKPDLILVYGDTNSTLAGALVAAKLLIPLAHIEAGMRSFNKKMPEEINRICTDHLSLHLFCPTETAANNLTNEGIKHGVYLVGDVMKDAVLQVLEIFNIETVLNNFGIGKSDKYYFMTMHRQENTDDIDRLRRILDFVGKGKFPVIFPVHPRTRKIISQNKIQIPDTVKLFEPVNYYESLALQMRSEFVITDSGGMQKEAYILNKPCITLRSETEWVETVEDGVNTLIDDNDGLFFETEKKYLNSFSGKSFERYGNGMASHEITKILKRVL